AGRRSRCFGDAARGCGQLLSFGACDADLRRAEIAGGCHPLFGTRRTSRRGRRASARVPARGHGGLPPKPGRPGSRGKRRDDPGRGRRQYRELLAGARGRGAGSGCHRRRFPSDAPDARAAAARRRRRRSAGGDLVSRLRVVVLFGGKSVEREVSIISARTISQALDPAKYEVIPLAIGPDGRFLATTPSAKLLTDWKAPEKFLGGDETRVSHHR